MKRKRYSDKVKASILATVQEARKVGKTWGEAFQASKQMGYKGTVEGLSQMIRNSKPTITAEPTNSPVNGSVVPESGTAQNLTAPARVKRKYTRTAAAPATSTASPAAKPSAGLDITALVHKAVTDAVVNALETLLVNIKGKNA